MKRFSPIRDTQRGSQSYMKKRRGRREIRYEQEEKRGDSRGERKIYAVLCSLSVLRRPDTHRDSQNWIGKRRGVGNRGDLREKMESQQWERVINTLLSKNGY